MLPGGKTKAICWQDEQLISTCKPPLPAQISLPQSNYLEPTRRHQMDTGQRRPEWAPRRELGRVPERAQTHRSQCLQKQEGCVGRRWGFAAGRGLP